MASTPELGWSDQIARIRRDAIAKVVEPFVEQAMGDYGSGSYDEDGMLDAILALPIEQARDRVIEAARAWTSLRSEDDLVYDAAEAELFDAVHELDTLTNEEQ